MQRRICSNENMKLYADLEIGSLYWNAQGISLYRYKSCILSKNRGIGRKSISKRASESARRLRRLVDLNLTKPQSIVSKSDTELKLENKVTALKEHLKEFENMCLAQKVQIADLQGVWGESNKSIKDLENWNKRLKIALVVFGTLFASSMIIVGYAYQSYDLFSSYYATSKTGLNALLTNPLLHRRWVQFGQLSRQWLL
jgi:hypothetical protein